MVTYVRPNALPPASSVNSDAAIVVDNDTAVEAATPRQVVDAGRPVASEAQALEGTDNETAMTPLTTKQALDDYPRPFVPLAGGTMTGALSLNANPSSALHAATKQYVDALPNLPADIKRTFGTVAELVASAKNAVGDYIRTLGYFSPGDGGGNLYQIVAAGAGTADGGSYIDLTGINGQAKGLFQGNVFSPRQWGAPASGDCSAQITAMSNYLTANLGTGTTAIKVVFDGVFQIANPVVLGSVGTGTQRSYSIDASGGLFTVISGGALEASGGPAVTVRNCHRSLIVFSQINCKNYCGALAVENCTNSQFIGPHAGLFHGIGVHIRGPKSTPEVSSSSGSVFTKITGNEWGAGSSEPESSYVSDGIVNDSFDIRVTHAHIGYCRRAMVNNSGSVEFKDCHPFNGSSGGASKDRFCFWNKGSANVNLDNTYADNGYIVDEGGGLNISNLKILDLGSDLTPPYVRIRTDVPNLNQTMVNVQTDIGFYTGPFDPTFANEDLKYHTQIQGGGFDNTIVREVYNKSVRYCQNGTGVPDYTVIKPGLDTSREIVYRYYPGSGSSAVRYKDGYAFFQSQGLEYGEVRVHEVKATGMRSNAGGDLRLLADGAQVVIKSGGGMNIANLPTSASGLATGDLWNDGGTLKIKL